MSDQFAHYATVTDILDNSLASNNFDFIAFAAELLPCAGADWSMRAAAKISRDWCEGAGNFVLGANTWVASKVSPER